MGGPEEVQEEKCVCMYVCVIRKVHPQEQVISRFEHTRQDQRCKLHKDAPILLLLNIT